MKTDLKSVLKLTFFFAIIGVSANLSAGVQVRADVRPAGEKKQSVLSLVGSFTTNSRYAIFKPDEKIEAELKVCGTRVADDQLLWQLKDYLGAPLEQGQFRIPKGVDPITVKITPAFHGSGYFELHARLKKANITLPHCGTRPSGVITYGVLPEITALPLASPEDSRFGIQGTTFCDSGKRLVGNSYNPYYSKLGVPWLYYSRRLQDLERTPGKFVPKLTLEQLKHSDTYMSSGRLAPMWDLHSIPAWMMKTPDTVKNPAEKHVTDFCQKYPPRSDAEYGALLEKVAAEVKARRALNFPYMKHNYYQIHWEPDWHWIGTEEEFINLYRVAYEATHKADPHAVLAGPCYGVLDRGNVLLESLLKKGLGQYLDGIISHAYSTKWLSPEESGLIQDMEKLVALTRKYLKPGAPIFQTEWGLSWRANYDSENVPREKLLREMAWQLRGHTIILGEGANSTWFFYASDFRADGFGLAYNLDYPEYCYGPVNISPKPATMAVCAMTRILEGTQSLGRIDYLGDNIVSYLFKRGDQLVMVLWSGDEKSRSLVLDTGAPEITRIDCMGNRKTIKCENDKIELRVNAVPQFLLGVHPEVVTVEKPIPVLQGEELDATGMLKEKMDGSSLIMSRGPVSCPIRTQAFELSSKFVPGDWLLKVTDPDTGRVLKGIPLKICKRTEIISLKPFGSGRRYVTELTNRSGKPVEGSVRLVAGRYSGTPVKVKIPANGTVQGVLKIPRKINDDEITVTFADIDGFSDRRTVSRSSALYAYDYSLAPPKIDGSLKDWQLENFTRMAAARDLAYKKAPWSGPDDLSMLYSLGYDQKNFYLALKVSDQTHFPPLKDNEPWRGDSVQIAFGLAVDAAGRAASIRKFSIELDRKNSALVKELSNVPPIPPIVKRIMTESEVRTGVKRNQESGITVYEIAIPWAVIAGGSKPDTVGLGVMLNDSDNQKEVLEDTRKTMYIGNGAGLFDHNLKLKTISTD